MQYKCYKCKEIKEKENFHKGNGLTPRNQVAAYCKLCMAEYGKAYSKKEVCIKARQKYRESVKNLPEVKLKQLLRIKHRDRSDLDFDWCWSQLQTQGFKCAITKQPFIWESHHPQTLSIDRIDNTKGYTKNNVRFICWWVNVAMGNWGLEKLQQLVKDLPSGE